MKKIMAVTWAIFLAVLITEVSGQIGVCTEAPETAQIYTQINTSVQVSNFHQVLSNEYICT